MKDKVFFYTFTLQLCVIKYIKILTYKYHDFIYKENNDYCYNIVT